MLSRPSFADVPATSVVNTTGLAVTDTEVTVGILHSVTGTMAISETSLRDILLFTQKRDPLGQPTAYPIKAASLPESAVR